LSENPSIERRHEEIEAFGHRFRGSSAIGQALGTHLAEQVSDEGFFG
jgi:hypothetical protein